MQAPENFEFVALALQELECTKQQLTVFRLASLADAD